MIDEILSRLPTKSLLRFRSVSKSLCDGIGSPDFIRLHTLRSPNKLLIIIHKVRYEYGEDTKTMYTIHSQDQLSSSYTGITPAEYPFGCIRTISGSCNGILCVYDQLRSAIHLWNPSIRRKATVYEHPSWDPCLAHGFGFDPVTGDYKILRASEAGTFVYTMKTHTWREIASPAYPVSYVNGSPCLFKITIIKGCLAVECFKDEGDDHRWIWVRNTAASWSVFELNKGERATYGGLLVNHYAKGIRVFNPETGVRSRLGHLIRSSFIIGFATCIKSLELLDIYEKHNRQI
ncbi:hypothetical protein L1987_63609 [Smallanthus sonchifolius]|uniref:Uncharacterized protein n=1 Tax=Smallanthus sonchifolius TaxID=185202 RepID=A0ACB9CDQ0_9ASTR|nr:hypothetical protein L1987_63609 [Smallanthus sonchifolius]